MATSNLLKVRPSVQLGFQAVAAGFRSSGERLGPGPGSDSGSGGRTRAKGGRCLTGGKPGSLRPGPDRDAGLRPWAREAPVVPPARGPVCGRPGCGLAGVMPAWGTWCGPGRRGSCYSSGLRVSRNEGAYREHRGRAARRRSAPRPPSGFRVGRRRCHPPPAARRPRPRPPSPSDPAPRPVIDGDRGDAAAFWGLAGKPYLGVRKRPESEVS